MSPIKPHITPNTRRFPRVSGDEPEDYDLLEASNMFSPRERG